MAQDDILQFDVPMDNFMLMHVVNSLHNLSDDHWGSFLTEGGMLFQ